MKKVIVTGFTLLASSFSAHAQVMEGIERLSCEAILCLSSSLRPHECNPSLNHYFSIKRYKKGVLDLGKTIKARKAFLNICPVSTAPNMSERIEEISQGAGRCDAEYLNTIYRSFVYRYKVIKRGFNYYYKDITKIPTVKNNKLPDYCVAYNDHAWTYDMSIKYVGDPLKGGKWVKASEFEAEQAKWEAEHTGEWASQWHYSTKYPVPSDSYSNK